MKKDIDNIRVDIEKALEAIARKYSCTFDVGTMRYTETSVKFPVELCKVIDGVTEQQREFEGLASSYGLKVEDYGREIVVNNRTIKITGINTRARKYPIEGEENGRGLKMTQEMVLAALKE